MKATNMTIEEQAAWEDLAKTGRLWKVLRDESRKPGTYQRALKAQIDKRRAAKAPP